jgi:hypothetical protein
MNQQQRAVVQQALEALEDILIVDFQLEDLVNWNKGARALRQLLEQPEQEPVACANGCSKFFRYTTPPAQPAVPLTDEQIDLLINGRGDEDDDDYVEPTGDGFGLTDEDLVKLIRRVEKHHGIEVKP